ncbi:MAG: nitrilase-related carbon-nitrogen hydrolase, partial [Spirochaetota bacterium]
DKSSMGNATPGGKIKVLSFLRKNEKITFAPQICYEIIIPSFTRKFTKKNAELIINATNDRWFGVTKASKQHLLLGAARAIENRMYLVRTTNSGISTVVSPTGEYVPFISKNGNNTKFTPLYEKDYMVITIKPLNIDTFYKKYGDIFAWILSIIAIILIIYSIVIGFKKKDLKNNEA